MLFYFSILNFIIQVNKQLPYLVSNVIELLDLEDQQEDEGANVDLDARKTKCAVIKTSTRATYFLPGLFKRISFI